MKKSQTENEKLATHKKSKTEIKNQNKSKTTDITGTNTDKKGLDNPNYYNPKRMYVPHTLHSSVPSSNPT